MCEVQRPLGGRARWSAAARACLSGAQSGARERAPRHIWGARRQRRLCAGSAGVGGTQRESRSRELGHGAVGERRRGAQGVGAGSLGLNVGRAAPATMLNQASTSDHAQPATMLNQGCLWRRMAPIPRCSRRPSSVRLYAPEGALAVRKAGTLRAQAALVRARCSRARGRMQGVTSKCRQIGRGSGCKCCKCTRGRAADPAAGGGGRQPWAGTGVRPMTHPSGWGWARAGHAGGTKAGGLSPQASGWLSGWPLGLPLRRSPIAASSPK